MRQHFARYWKHYLIVFIILGSATWGFKSNVIPSPNPTPTPIASSSPSPLPTGSSNCDPSLWNHVYHGPKFQEGVGTGNARLSVLQDCVTVTGTIDFVRVEADGDSHIGVRLDSQYAGMVNDCNSSCLNGAEHGDLVVEPICMNPVSQRDTNEEGVCNGFSQTLTIPNVGDHVSVTGTYVKDNDHGWLEVHPVTSISIE